MPRSVPTVGQINHLHTRAEELGCHICPDPSAHEEFAEETAALKAEAERVAAALEAEQAKAPTKRAAK